MVMPVSVLLVDDDLPILQTLKGVLETRNFSVATACSAGDAVRALAAAAFDLVVTDMRMETPTAGYEVVRTARDHPQPPVVVILTAYPIPAPEWRASGADALFVKGGGFFRMLDDLERLVSVRRARPAARVRKASGRKAG